LAFVRYDLWPGLLRAAKDGGVRVSLLAATTRGTRGGIFGALSGLRRRFVHGELDAVFTVDSIDVAPLAASAPRAVVVHAGDPKWARAKERAEALRTRGLSTRLGALSSLCREFQARGGKVFVFGSPHAEEHGVALRCASLEGALVVYVPHDVAPASLAQLEAEITAQGLQPARCHGLTRIEAPLPDIIVVDVMGLLAEIYSLADAAIVGGGFDGQVHNTLEPAAHPVAVLMGSSLTRAPEAQQLVASGAAQAFDSPEAMFQFLSACVRIGVASDEGVSPRPAQRQLVELRRRSLELFKCVPATSEVVSKTLFS
jgi:3-deoxy-D-manno-octulosonic-acid transferase